MAKIPFRNPILFGVLFSLLLSACSNEKSLVNFQKTNKNQDTISITTAYVPKIQTGDILSIYVNSLSPEASSFFNPYKAGVTSNGSTDNATSGYLVDASGDIELPLVGNIRVTGHTTSQVRDTLKVLLKQYLKEPTVLVRFLNFKISLLGEVAKPNVYNIPNEMITLPEALSMAGDLTSFARRDSIQIIRDVNGKKEFGYVNLTNRNVFSSPYYYLHANDLVYVKPSKIKARQNDRSFQFVTLGISLLSLIIIIIR
ncbi:MAG: Polysaccharide biosynthesis/export protein [Mucilaginibacter sp.]|nr:Polysaccharide biosynthesis/export protein [Mucilaginibacter sp.]